MSGVLSAAEALRKLADHEPGYGYTKVAIATAAKRSGLSVSRVFDIWYGKAKRVERHELDAIGDALEQKNKEAERNEIHEIRLRLARIEARLSQTDSEFYRPTIEWSREQIAGPVGLADARRKI